MVSSIPVVVVAFWYPADDVFAGIKFPVLGGFVGLLAATAAIGLWNGSLVARWQSADLAVASWVGWTLISQVSSVAPDASWNGEPYQFQGTIATVLYGVAYAAARLAYSPDRTRHLRWSVVSAAFLAAGYGIVQWLGLDPIWSDLLRGRIFSTVGQPNPLGAVLVVGLVVALVPTHRAERWGMGLMASVIGVGLVLTFSRGAYLAAAVIGLMWLVAIRQQIGFRRIGTWLLAGVVLLAGFAVTFPVGQLAVDRALSVFGPLDDSNRDRLDLWLIGGHITADHPLVGTGPDTYATVFPEYRDRHLAPEHIAALLPFRPESPHNVYLAISSGSGLPALLAYLIAVGLAMRMMARGARRQPWLWVALAATAAHLVTDLFITAELSGAWMFWVIIGWSVSMAQASDSSTSQQARPESSGPGDVIT